MNSCVCACLKYLEQSKYCAIFSQCESYTFNVSCFLELVGDHLEVDKILWWMF